MFLLLAFIRLPSSSRPREAEHWNDAVVRDDGDDVHPETEPLLDQEVQV